MRKSFAVLAVSGPLLAAAGCASGTPAASPGRSPEVVADSEATPGDSAVDATAGDSSPHEPAAPDDTRVEVTISGFDYQLPDRVPPGATIAVTNEDDVLHTFTMRGAGGGGVPPGQTVEFSAPQRPGEYAVVCYFHSAMSSTLVVA